MPHRGLCAVCGGACASSSRASSSGVNFRARTRTSTTVTTPVTEVVAQPREEEVPAVLEEAQQEVPGQPVAALEEEDDALEDCALELTAPEDDAISDAEEILSSIGKYNCVRSHLTAHTFTCLER